MLDYFYAHFWIYILKIKESIPYFSPILKCSAIVLGITLLLLICRFVYYLVLRWIKKKTPRLKDFGNQIRISNSQLILLGVFASALVLFFKVCEPSDGAFAKFTQSVIDTLRLFTFELRLPELREMVFSRSNDLLDVKSSGFELVFSSAKDLLTTENGCWLSNLYLSFMALLAPLCTVTAAISLLFNDLFVALRYLFSLKAFVLSELNENSVSLAKDLRNNHPFAPIIFTGVRKNDSENEADDLLGQAKEINAKTIKKSVADFHFLCLKKTHVYLIDKEEKNNVKNGKKLFEKHRKKNIIINVFSTLKSAETFIDNIDKNKAKAVINLIDPAQIIAYSLLMDEPMFKAADDCGSGTMSVLVVGAGYVGMECAKAAMWCGVMDSLKFKIRIIDKDDREAEFDSEVSGFRNNLSGLDCGVDYRFYRADVNEKWFMRTLENCGDANYIIVSVGDDEQTINTYKKIRQFYTRRAVDSGNYEPEKMPVIIPIIRSEVYNDLLRGSVNSKMHPVGCNSEIYKEKVIDEWSVEKFAEDIHEFYRENDWNIPEYKDILQTHKRSSRACAVHSLYKLRDMGVCLDLTEKYSQKVERRKAAKQIKEKQRQEEEQHKKKERWEKEQKQREEEKCIKKNQRSDDKKKLDEYIKEKANSSGSNSLTSNEHNRWCVFQLLDGWTGISVENLVNVREPETDGTYYQKVESAKMHATIAKNDRLQDIGDALKNDTDAFIRNDRSVTEFVSSDIVTAMEKAYNKDVKIIYK